MQVNVTTGGFRGGRSSEAAKILKMLDIPYSTEHSWSPLHEDFSAELIRYDDMGEAVVETECGWWYFRNWIFKHGGVSQILFLWLIARLTAQNNFATSAMPLLITAMHHAGIPGIQPLSGPMPFSKAIAWWTREIRNGWVTPPKGPRGAFVLTREGLCAVEELYQRLKQETSLFPRFNTEDMLGLVQDALEREYAKEAVAA